jgi:hypothetical protein
MSLPESLEPNERFNVWTGHRATDSSGIGAKFSESCQVWLQYICS